MSLLHVTHVSFKSIFSKKQPRSHLEETTARLPLEIPENIFIHAARDPSLRSLTVTIMRVSHWVHDLVQPYLYHSVQLKKKVAVERFLFTITKNPTICRFIVNLDVPEINKPYTPGEESASWEFSASKKSPDFDTMAKLIRILFECKLDKETQNKTHNEDQNQTTFHPPIASALQSVTIHSRYLSDPHQAGIERRFQGVRKLLLPPVVTITAAFGLVIRNGLWDFTHVKNLRFTSPWMNMHPYIQEIVTLPQLTHLALRLQEDVTNNVMSLLACRRIRKLAIFTLYGPESAIIPRQISGVPSTSKTLTVTADPSFEDTWEDTERLGNIADDRLFLFDDTEMQNTYKMSNEAFWDAIERL